MIQVPPGTHSVLAAVLLSIFVGGWAGGLINRQYTKALVLWLLGGMVVTWMTCGLGLIIWYPLSLIDTIMIANRLNRGEPVREWQFF